MFLDLLGIINASDISGVYKTKTTFMIDCIIGIFSLVGTYAVQRGLYYIYSNKFFNSQACKYLNIGGYLLIFTVIIEIFIGPLLINYNMRDPGFEVERTIDNAILIFMFFMGIGALILSDITKRGTEIKEDNDLTI